MRIIGILSDTHEYLLGEEFQLRATKAFAQCDTIIHAGDLTDISLLNAFAGKEVFAVHGNMCNHLTQKELPESRLLNLDGYSVGLCHGAGNRHNIEDRMFSRFPEADCIIFGHTHTPVCAYYGSTLMINPGSFQATGRHGSQGSYAILEISKSGLSASLYELSPSL